VERVDEDVAVLVGGGADLHCCRCLSGLPAPRHS
jgi:hypothetical protein